MWVMNKRTSKFNCEHMLLTISNVGDLYRILASFLGAAGIP